MLIGACSDVLLDQLFSRELPGHASTSLQSALLTRALLHTKLVTSSHRVDAEALRQQAGGGAHVSAVPLIFQQYIAQLAQARLRLHVIATGAVAVKAAQADMVVTKTDGVTSAIAGSDLTYTIVVLNNGPSDF